MISKEEIEHLKDLARVPARRSLGEGGEFGEKETKKLAKDLGEILVYIDQLKEVDVVKVSEMTHALEGVKNVYRKDEGLTRPITPSITLREEEERGRVIDSFPEKADLPAGGGHGTYLKVKNIL